MSKKLFTMFLSIAMMFCAMTPISASNGFMPIPDNRYSHEAGKIEDDHSFMMLLQPGQIDKIGGSASVIFHAFEARRLSNGNVNVTIHVSFCTVRGYYQHLATDAAGVNYIPERDSGYFNAEKGIYTITLLADNVSKDGFVYMYFAIAPNGVDYMLQGRTYKLPVQ